MPDAATIGDIFATRAFKLGATGIVTDGALRDTPAIAELHQPVYHFASHGATLGRQHMPFSVDEPVTCAGVFVVPGDVIVGDGEGAVVIPIALVADVVKDALDSGRARTLRARTRRGRRVDGWAVPAVERTHG